MREVSASRFVRATPATVERALTPRSLVEYEGSFTVYEVEDTDEGWLVIAGSRGVELALAFELDGEGLTYEQRGDGPLETLETTITYEPKDQGTSVRMRSRVSAGLPLASLTDRVAAWKRRGELRRALSRLAADVE
ncbi:SRPBCC family protein [Halococcus qingdaonensis]|uniref:SRPBCC family protein n=1 Tax=Halococcus qingdaonensis TaxID=224402 RepID=UPI002116E180|nr:SRPBCC family protein [Halococcus qingdaonensis]